jgi:hypothetical protein
MTEKPMPMAERRQETIAAHQSSSWSRWMTGGIPGLVLWRGSVLTRSGESVKRKKSMPPEPEDELDANGPGGVEKHAT